MRAPILIVDDEPFIRRMCARMLNEEFDVRLAATAADALALVAAGERFAALVLDEHMPVKDGVSLFHDLQSVAPELSRRVIFITGDFRTDHLHALGAVAVLEKPFAMDDLTDLVRGLAYA